VCYPGMRYMQPGEKEQEGILKGLAQVATKGEAAMDSSPSWKGELSSVALSYMTDRTSSTSQAEECPGRVKVSVARQAVRYTQTLNGLLGPFTVANHRSTDPTGLSLFRGSTALLLPLMRL
jgi:hypothetical protein